MPPRGSGFADRPAAPTMRIQPTPPCNHVGAGVSAPKIMYFPTCEMPELARKLRAQGNVTLPLAVSAEGAIRDVRVVKPAG